MCSPKPGPLAERDSLTPGRSTQPSGNDEANMKMVRWLLVAFFCSTLNPLRAQVPQLINFQGRVAVDGVNLNGTGQFKFVLVNGDGSVSFWSNDGTSVGGSEPTNAVPIAVSQGLYSVLLGNATLTNMTPISAAIFTNSDVR